MGHDKNPFSAHAFDPNRLKVLYKAYDAAWKVVQPMTNEANCDRVRDVIAVALLDMAKAGQQDAGRLEAYAIDRARVELCTV
jgi:hypothetical protein